MILSYTFPQFEQKILDGEKIHTFRLDPHRRWRAGLSIQHWMGSPRNSRSNPRQFHESTCTLVQDVKIIHVANAHRYLLCGVEYRFHEMAIIINQKRIYLDDQCLEIIQNDGLSKDEFISFFVPNTMDLRDTECVWNEPEDFVQEKSAWIGRIIHWTPNLY